MVTQRLHNFQPKFTRAQDVEHSHTNIKNRLKIKSIICSYSVHDYTTYNFTVKTCRTDRKDIMYLKVG